MHDLNPYLPFTQRFEAASIRYAAGGGVAAIVYGEPRLTLDVLLDLRVKQMEKLVKVFPECDFYVPPIEVIRMEIARDLRGHMNRYHHSWGIRADIYLRSRDFLDTWSLDNAVRVEIDGGSIMVVPAEAVIIRKLEYFREGGSEKHARDIQTILAVPATHPHRLLMEQWIADRQLSKEWSIILRNVELATKLTLTSLRYSSNPRRSIPCPQLIAAIS
jgi:hypothetical protein